MVFSSLVFLCFYMPVVLLLYCLCPAKLRNGILFFVSLLFYAWGEPVYVLIMLFSTVFDYCNGRILEYLTQKRDSVTAALFEQKDIEVSDEKPVPDKQEALFYTKLRKAVLVISVVGNLGILCVFKYADFVLGAAGAITGLNLPLLELALPIGISFYTFQTMSYTIDVYRGRVKAQHNIITFGMYVSMFPQLIAGPIVRYATVEDQLNNRKLVSRDMALGMQRFLFGLAKKVLLANQIGALWTEISGQSTQTVASAWLGAFAFTFQIYFDFSGYSDMAIGLGQIFGFRFPENFEHPYESKSITEFWRRWHITLSSWFKEYVYIPLGGNRLGEKRQIWNLFIVWSLTGLWHGASWNFLLWGIYYFLLLSIEKSFLLNILRGFQDWVCHVYTMFFVVLGWMVFANERLITMIKFIAAMFGRGAALYDGTAIYLWYTHLPLLVILAVGATTLPKRLAIKLGKMLTKNKENFSMKYGERVTFILVGLYTVVLLVLSLAFLVSGSYNPFLYFRF
ncbi:MAG: MBOAT family protein [Lachnospiraceae bacterium]|nr:MBOAT family protein [Lachnospiraceae bacterium]